MSRSTPQYSSRRSAFGSQAGREQEVAQGCARPVVLYFDHGKAGLQSGYYPRWGERVGRLATFFELPQAPRKVDRTPNPLLRASAQDPRPPRSRPFPSLLWAFGRRCMVRRRRLLPGSGGVFSAPPALARPRRTLPPRRLRGPVRLHCYLARALLPARVSLATHSGAGSTMGLGSLRRGCVARGRALGSPGDRSR
jgi:hypothetical protein